MRVAVRDTERGAVPQADGRGRTGGAAACLADQRADGASRGGRRGSGRQHGGHPGRTAIGRLPAHPCRGRRPGGASCRDRRCRAPGAHLGDRRRSARRQPLCRDQGHRRGDAARGVPRRHDPAPVAGVRPGGRAVQPLRGDGAPAADHAGDLRRYALPAGLCRRRGRRGDGGTGAAGCRRRGLRTRRTARLASSASCWPTS